MIDNGGALQERKERHAQLEMPVDYLCDEAEEVVPDDASLGRVARSGVYFVRWSS